MDIEVCVFVAGFDVMDCEVRLIPGGGEILLKLVDGEWEFVAGIMSGEDAFEDKVGVLLSAEVDRGVRSGIEDRLECLASPSGTENKLKSESMLVFDKAARISLWRVRSGIGRSVCDIVGGREKILKTYPLWWAPKRYAM
jgi:hypothetical protein